MTVLILALTFVFIGSFFCSLSEASFYSVPGSFVERLVREGKSAGKILKQLRHDVQKPISAILIVNTLANSAAGVIVGASAAQVFGTSYLTVFSLVFSFLLLIFGEVIPKTAGVSYARTLSVWIAKPLQILVWLLTPIIWGCMMITRIVLRGKRHEHTISAEEIVVMARLGHEHGVIDEHEVSVIENILDLADKTVESVMTPQSEITKIGTQETVADAKSMGRLGWHSRIPVQEDEVTVGIVFRRQILSEIAHDRPGTTIGDLMKPAYFVSSSTRLDEALKRFLENRQHLMVVINDAGKEVGIVTLEDVIEEILGKKLTESRDSSGEALGIA